MSAVLTQDDNALLLVSEGDSARPESRVCIEQVGSLDKPKTKAHKDRKRGGRRHAKSGGKTRTYTTYSKPAETQQMNNSPKAAEEPARWESPAHWADRLHYWHFEITTAYKDILFEFTRQLIRRDDETGKPLDSATAKLLRQPLNVSLDYFTTQWDEVNALKFLERRLELAEFALWVFAPIERRRLQLRKEEADLLHEQLEASRLEIVEELKSLKRLGDFKHWLRFREAALVETLVASSDSSISRIRKERKISRYSALQVLKTELEQLGECILQYSNWLTDLEQRWERVHEEYGWIGAKLTRVDRVAFGLSFAQMMARYSSHDADTLLRTCDRLITASSKPFVTTKPNKGNAKADAKKKAKAAASRLERNKMRGDASKKKGGDK
jgi:hypothetical protein